MTKKLVSELEGTELDYWVARSERLVTKITDGKNYITEQLPSGDWVSDLFSPSEDWSLGGPLIDKYDISFNGTQAIIRKPVEYEMQDGRKVNTNSTIFQNGKSKLQAAMRCIVASEFGETVEDK